MRYINFSFVVISIALLVSCNKKEGTAITRGMKNFKSYFNGYYHANVKFKEGVKQANANFKAPEDDQNISILNISDPKENKNASGFDEVIKKCDIIIFKHRIQKKQEPLKPWVYKRKSWVDDSRLLIGKSWFYKGNLAVAKENFEHIVTAFPKSEERDYALLWLAKTHFFNDNLPAAKSNLDQLYKEFPEMRKKVKAEASLLMATFLLQDGETQKALQILEDGLDSYKNKQTKAKVYFLLGQIYDSKKDFTQSYDNYLKVVKLNVSNQMTFQANIRLARLLVKYQQDTDGVEGIAKSLKKMSNDVKYEEYSDQIYYELAMLELKKNEKAKAIEYLKMSTAKSKGNNNQKSISYFQIGKMYFAENKFSEAQAYYDSAASVVPKTSKNYDEIKATALTLKDYVKFSKSIAANDSLLNLSKMSKSELETYVDEYIEKETKRKEQEEKIKEAQSQQTYRQDPNYTNQPNQSGGFYFDNQNLVASGKAEFQRFWGARENADDWRRKNKEQVFSSTETENEFENTNNTAKLKEKLMANVPVTDSAKTACHEKIQESMFGLGQLFYQNLNQPDSAINVFNKLITRYPDSRLLPQTYFSLYNIYNTKEDLAKALEYKKIIQDKFPGSTYDKLLRNEKSEAVSETDTDFLDAYQALFNSYQAEEYETVLNLSQFMLSKFSKSPDLAKVYYLRGLAFGHKNNLDSLKTIFTFLKKTYPNAEVTEVATRTLNFMTNGSSSEVKDPKDQPKNNPNEERFIGFSKKKNQRDQIFVIFLVDKNKTNINDFKVAASDLLKSKFASNDYKFQSFIYQNTHWLGYFHAFPDFKTADLFASIVKEDAKLRMWFDPNPDKSVFFMTSSNFSMAFGQKKMMDYIDFYLKYKDEIMKSN